MRQVTLWTKRVCRVLINTSVCADVGRDSRTRTGSARVCNIDSVRSNASVLIIVDGLMRLTSKQAHADGDTEARCQTPLNYDCTMQMMSSARSFCAIFATPIGILMLLAFVESTSEQRRRRRRLISIRALVYGRTARQLCVRNTQTNNANAPPKTMAALTSTLASARSQRDAARRQRGDKSKSSSRSSLSLLARLRRRR